VKIITVGEMAFFVFGREREEAAMAKYDETFQFRHDLQLRRALELGADHAGLGMGPYLRELIFADVEAQGLWPAEDDDQAGNDERSTNDG